MDIRKGFLQSYYSLIGKNTLKYLQMIEKTQFLSIEEIEKIQYKKLKNLIFHSYNNIPFYKRLFAKISN